MAGSQVVTNEVTMGLNVTAPAGSHFEYEEVKTAKGTQSLGEKPLLVWDDIEAVRVAYGDEGLKDILDGTSCRVSFQAIARRMSVAGKSDDEIAQAQVSFKPGKRVGGASTPTSRAKRAAGDAAAKISNPDAITALMEKIAKGEISEADLAALVG